MKRGLYLFSCLLFWLVASVIAPPVSAAVPAQQSAPAPSQEEPTFAGVPPAPREAVVGEHVALFGKHLPLGKAVSVALRAASDDKEPAKILPGVIVSDASKSTSPFVDFRIEDVNFGRYLVTVNIDKGSYAVPGELRVISASVGHLDALEPNIVYPKNFGGPFTFKLSGQNLGTERKDITLQIEGEGPVLLNTTDACQDNANAKAPCIDTVPSLPGQVLIVRNFPDRQGEARFKVKVAQGAASNAVPVRFSYTPESYVRPITLGICAVLLVVVALVLLSRKRLTAASTRQFIAEALLLDPKSNTFSLSKFQLLVWTAAAVFGYTYLFLCRSLVQWSLELPPIPDGLPNLLGLSVGTTVISSGITGVRGSKGSGLEKPSFADLFASGGMVAGERFQFFVWTIIGFFGFITIVLMSNPATLAELPKIPDGFLPLMGISAVGYLGGKVARGAGPIIKTLAISYDEIKREMTMTLQGENLSANATIYIDDQLMRAGLSTLNPVKGPDPVTNMCTEIRVLLTEADAFAVDTHTLKFKNSDGQIAVMTFPLDALTITKPATAVEYTAPSGAVSVQLEVDGDNFDNKIQFRWTPHGGTATNPAPTTFVSKKKLTVQFVPGSAGKGKLTLISAAHLRATTEVRVN